jgi:hypothetical protein
MRLVNLFDLKASDKASDVRRIAELGPFSERTPA